MKINEAVFHGEVVLNKNAKYCENSKNGFPRSTKRKDSLNVKTFSKLFDMKEL